MPYLIRCIDFRNYMYIVSNGIWNTDQLTRGIQFDCTRRLIYETMYFKK
jgi:hypothetical protein